MTFFKECFFIVFLTLLLTQDISAHVVIGSQTQDTLTASSSVTLKGTEVKNETRVEGTLLAEKASLDTVHVDGSGQFEGSRILGKTTINGAFRFNKGQAEELEIKGSASITDADVRGRALIDGVLTSVKTSFKGSVQVNGGAILTRSRIQGGLTLDGFLLAQSSIFDGHVSLGVNEASFVDCKLADIVVRKIKDDSDPQILVLAGTTLVSGDIIFEKPGFVFVRGENVVLRGEIKKGKKVTQKEEIK